MSPVFLLLSAVIAIASLGVVTSRSVFRGAFFLALSLVATAFLYLDMIPLLAAVQILLYTGGVLTLVIFAVMLSGKPELPMMYHKPFQAAVASFLAFFALLSVFSRLPEPTMQTTIQTRYFAAYFFQKSVIAFEILSLLLLAALIGALSVARHKEETP